MKTKKTASGKRVVITIAESSLLAAALAKESDGRARSRIIQDLANRQLAEHDICKRLASLEIKIAELATQLLGELSGRAPTNGRCDDVELTELSGNPDDLLRQFD